MQTIPLRRFQGMLVCTVALALMLLFTACAGTGASTGQPTTSTTTTTTTTSATQVPTTATQQPTPPAIPAAFKASGTPFIAPPNTITTSNPALIAPNRH